MVFELPPCFCEITPSVKYFVKTFLTPAVRLCRGQRAERRVLCDSDLALCKVSGKVLDHEVHVVDLALE